MILRYNLWFKLMEIKSNEICDERPSITDILYTDTEKQKTMQNKRMITP